MFLFISISAVFAQNKVEADTARILDEIIIQAYGYKRPAVDVPASVAFVGMTQLQRFANTSLVPVMNTIPGVRMEERSPGSYRFAIRGSSLRSPFGVRNVKIYWNGLPLTDAGNNTYLNQLDFNSIGNAEVIKGPGSSLYGVGTGGAILLNGVRATPTTPLATLNLQVGSFGLFNYNASVMKETQSANHVFQLHHFQSDGYRDNSRMIRDMINWQEQFSLADNKRLSTSVFYSDVFYQTPGGLTEAEMEADPEQARPNAEARNAHVHAKALYSGIAAEFNFSSEWSNTTGVYGHFIQFENSTFRNYERRAEQGGGARTVIIYAPEEVSNAWKITGGAELQFTFIPSKVYDNSVPDSLVLQQDDELNTTQYFFYIQGDVTFFKSWIITAGLSYSSLKYHFIRLTDNPDTEQKLTYDPELSPRLAVLKKFQDSFSIYASVSKGFSPPSYAEVYPSEGTFNTTLAPELGFNYEGGVKGSYFRDQLTHEITFYQFNLEETIVLRRATDGAEYFVNAGNTSQRGIEVLLNYNPRLTSGSGNFLDKFNVWLSYTYNNYHFKNYIKDQDDYSGNEMTGVPRNVLSTGIDFSTRTGFYLRTTFNFTDQIPLDDANTVYADSYFLVGSRLGYSGKRFEVFAGVDNLTNERYSLGNDVNAVNGRYYNPAPTRNFYAGLKISLK